MKRIIMLGLMMLPIMINAKDLTKPMEFIQVTPCLGTSNNCVPYILGQGKFVKSTPDKLEKLLKKSGINKVAFDSDGGEFESALEVGMVLASNGIEAILQNRPYENEVPIKGSNETKVVELSDLPQCKNECGYAFLGGVVRNIEEDADFSIKPLKKVYSESKKYSAKEIKNILSGMSVSENLLKILNQNEKELSFSNTELIKLNIDNYSKQEFNWVYQKKGLSNIGIKSIVLSEGRGRLVLSIKKDNLKNQREQYSMDILFKPLFDNKNFVKELADVNIGIQSSEKVIWKKSTKWEEKEGIILTTIPLGNVQEIQAGSEVDIWVDLPQNYYSLRLDTSFYTDKVFTNLENMK